MVKFDCIYCAVIFVNLIFNLNYCNIILMFFFFLFLCCVVNTTNWVFLIPSGPLVSSITVSQYAIILTIQIVQVFALSLLLCIADSLFFNVTIHLTGQLEVLKNKFKTFANELNTEANYRKKFVDLINRHSKLMELYQNLEDSFHFLILSQLVVTTIMLALMGNV